MPENSNYKKNTSSQTFYFSKSSDLNISNSRLCINLNINFPFQRHWSTANISLSFRLFSRWDRWWLRCPVRWFRWISVVHQLKIQQHRGKTFSSPKRSSQASLDQWKCLDTSERKRNHWTQWGRRWRANWGWISRSRLAGRLWQQLLQQNTGNRTSFKT